ncbi:hypothetical protein ACROYT_G016908 [Oculina patagonica]
MNETFLLAQSDYNEWLRVWKMTIPEGSPISKDLFAFEKKKKVMFVDLVENEIRDLESVKISFELQIKFTKENFKTGVTQEMDHYFKEKEPNFFNEHNKQQIKQEFDRFIDRVKGQIEAWSERGSGWVLERIMAAYLNVARYQPLRGGTYLSLPAKLAKKKAIINVINRDNECLKWALRAALFPPSDGKNPQRTSKYPVNDGINYEGIVFPTPVNQIDKLEAQNSNLAINVFGWRYNRVIVHRMSEKEKTIPRINLMLIESGLIHCWEVFLKHLLNEEKRIRSSLKIQKPLKMTAKDWKEHKNATSCHICNKSLIRDSFFDSFPVWDHDKGKFRGSAHNACNLKLRINPKTDHIPVVFHNLRGYDAHHLMQAMSKLPFASKKEVKCGANNMEVKCVANNMEKYITFSLGGLRFIDSLNFLQGSLDSLGIYPYEYMDSWERFNETSLPEKEKFYSKLNDEHITDEEYEHANSVWKTFGCKTLGDYHDLYIETDVTLLADVFENFRNICKEKYELDPANYFTSPGLSWDALLKKTGVQLELLTDYDMHLFVERGIRGGISMFYLKQGMKLKKVHRVLEFEQECWMEPYIRMNTEFRKKAKNDFEKNFYKLMNNSVFGKTMENLRNRVDIKIVRSDEKNKIRKLVASPLYSRHFLFSNDLVGIEMRKSLLFLNKPVYTGMTILDNSKILMYDFFYNHLKKKYGSRCELLYTDTDSLLVEIETEDVYEDMSVDKEKYDTSDYPKDHPLFCDKNKKVLGKMKDE